MIRLIDAEKVYDNGTQELAGIVTAEAKGPPSSS